MAPPSTAAVTAQGIRDGEPGALRALVKRRGSAVLAYAQAVAAPGDHVEAAGQAFAGFRREVVAAPDPRTLDPEALLLRTTRRAAATRAPRHDPPPGLLARRWAGTCPLVPELLAARLGGDLTPADDQRLERHLERCPGCRGLEERFRAGEEAYREAEDGPPPSAVLGGLVAALRAAAPNREREDPQRNGVKATPPVPVPAPVPVSVSEAKPEPVVAATRDEPPPVAPAPAAAPAAADVDGPTLSWAPGDLEPPPAPAGPDPSRRGRVILAGIVLPAVVLLGAFIAALVAGGAFDGAEDAAAPPPTPTEQAPIRNPPNPSTTPLPERTGGAQPASAPARTTAEEEQPEREAPEPEAATPSAPVPAAIVSEPPPPDPTPPRPANDGGAEAPNTGGADSSGP